MIKRGRGYASIHYGIGNAGRPNPSSAVIEMSEDGSCLITCGAADLGQGSDTTLCQIAAATLGIPVEKVTITSADTRVTPEAGVSSASRQTYVSGNAVRLAAEQLRELICAEASVDLECQPDDLEVCDNWVFARTDEAKGVSVPDVCGRLRNQGVLALGTGTFSPPTIVPLDPQTSEGISNGAFVFGTQCVEVEVDTETGEVRVTDVIAAHDVGCCVNPMAVEGQIEGGVVMASGYGLLEEIRWDEQGNMLTVGFDTYLIPTVLDAPHVTPLIVEDPDPSGPFGAKGVGEPPAAMTAAAILNAIYDAVGVRLESLPVTPEKVYAALQELNQGTAVDEQRCSHAPTGP